MRKNTLIIGTWSSKCGECGKGADPYEKKHLTVLGYGKNLPAKLGCKTKWTKVTSDYVGLDMEERCKKMRPDLTWVDSVLCLDPAPVAKR